MIISAILLMISSPSARAQGGVPLWTNRYEGGTYLPRMTVDNAGNVFVTGYSTDSLGNEDYVTIKYSNAGLPLWTNRYDGANSYDEAVGIAVDTSGNVFVTGNSYNGSDISPVFLSSDFATVAYSNAGVPLWTNRYDGPAQLLDEAKAIAVDTSGNVFVTGRSFGNFDNPIKQDYATIAYSNSGELLWENRYNPGSLYTAPRAIAVDSSGNVFVTGDSATVAYSIAGVRLWTRLYTGGSYTPEAIAVDSSGNVFVTGGSSSGGTTVAYSGTTLAYSNSGVPLWTKRVGNVYLSQMAVDRGGNVFVTGSWYDGTNSAYVTIKYSSSIPLPRLDFQTLNNALVLSWTNAGFHLQTAPAVTGTFTNILGATSPYTNVTTSAQQFFRLVGD